MIFRPKPLERLCDIPRLVVYLNSLLSRFYYSLLLSYLDINIATDLIPPPVPHPSDLRLIAPFFSRIIEGSVLEAVVMAQTKVAKLIKVLQDDNLAAGVFEAIVKNDEDIFKEVLEDTNLSSTDFSLSEDEIENYIEGLEPSGTLDLCTFEGYYESEDWPPDKSQFAFLILSSTEKVYCASRDELLADPSKHAVEHTLTQGGWLNFVTPHWGLVNIRFQRDWDEEDGTSWCRFVVCLHRL